MHSFQLPAHETCNTCSAPLNGRADQRFCDDACRVRFHRKQASGVLQEVDRVLHNNRKLLKRLRADTSWSNSPPVECFMWLRRAGYDFNFHTHVAGLHDGRLAVMCYEEGFVLEGDGVKLLPKPIEQQPWMEVTVAEPHAVWCDLGRLMKRRAQR